MLTNRELFARDPLATALPNDGVAKVTTPSTDDEWKVLRYELATFVCEGEYQRGLSRILGTYLTSLGEPTQPAVWVSGFFGSGKSHLVRVLEYLWTDVTFPDGATARGLAKLPTEIEAHLKELSVQGKRAGGLWSGAGTLGAGAGDSVRLALLAIAFRAAGLPEQYPAARFVLWLRQNNLYEAVRAGVEAAGKAFETELRQMYVSPVLAGALLAASPGFADTGAGARALFKEQFPFVTDISDEEMVGTLGEVLALQSSASGKAPCTLIVLDELQQYIGDNSDRTLRVQNVVQACSSRFGSRLLFVATGQSALQANPQLQKLQDRFTVRVQLSDKDVETVVRSVVLRKAPDKLSALREALDAVSGEIDRHLPGTRIAPESGDREALAADYPLLPTRRRFWERVLRAVDRAGVAGQLRTQLRVVHEATRAVAKDPVGHVVAGDFVYGQLAPSLLQTGVLLREVDEIIRRQNDGTEDGALRSRLSALVFLIGQLPRDAGSDAGVRATAPVLADLLVGDLRAGSAALRQRVPDLLSGMIDSGSLMLVEDEYRLQTRESAEWEADYRSRYHKVFADEGKVASDRATELRKAVTERLKTLSFLQGESKTPRKVDLHFGAEEPKVDAGSVPVWVRDEWSASEKTVREDAQGAGPDAPVVYVFLPRRGADDLKRALAGYAAATETLHARPTPTTREGEEARAAMASRQGEQGRLAVSHITAILRDARVFQGGGNEVAESDLRGSVEAASKASLARLYPQFAMGDHARWDAAVKRAQEGNGAALTVVGHTAEDDKHPVCKAVLEFAGTAGKKGSEVRRRFTAPPFGWPQDAVDAALLVLLHGNALSATLNGSVVAAAALDRPKISLAEFRREGVTVTALQRIEVRKLLAAQGLQPKANAESVFLPRYVEGMIQLASEAGGPKPLPLPPDVSHLEPLRALSGNELVMAAYEGRERLGAEAKAWAETRDKARARLRRWEALQSLLKHASGLPVHAHAAAQATAIRDDRALLCDPNPVLPLCDLLADALREAVKASREEHLEEYRAQIDGLLESSAWKILTDGDRAQIRASHGLGPVPDVTLGTEEELLATLDALPLSYWEERTAALAERVKRALVAAAKRVEPNAVRVSVPSATLTSEAEVDAYLAQVRETLLAHIAAGNPVVI